MEGVSRCYGHFRKLTGIAKLNILAVGKMENEMDEAVVWITSIVISVEKMPGHFHMDDNSDVSGEIDQDIFCPARDMEDGFSFY